MADESMLAGLNISIQTPVVKFTIPGDPETKVEPSGVVAMKVALPKMAAAKPHAVCINGTWYIRAIFSKAQMLDDVFSDNGPRSLTIKEASELASMVGK